MNRSDKALCSARRRTLLVPYLVTDRRVDIKMFIDESRPARLNRVLFRYNQLCAVVWCRRLLTENAFRWVFFEFSRVFLIFFCCSFFDFEAFNSVALEI